MRLLPVLFFIAALAIAAPVLAQPRDEAPEATPAGPLPSAAEELTSKTTEQEEPSATKEETKKEPEKEAAPKKKPATAKKEKKAAPKPAKKPAPVKEEPKEEAKAEPKKEPAEKKTAPAAKAGGDPVIVINPCTGDVSEELKAPPQVKTPRAVKKSGCLTSRQCSALCLASQTFGSDGGSPQLTAEGDITFGAESFATLDDCISTCGPKCE